MSPLQGPGWAAPTLHGPGPRPAVPPRRPVAEDGLDDRQGRQGRSLSSEEAWPQGGKACPMDAETLELAGTEPAFGTHQEGQAGDVAEVLAYEDQWTAPLGRLTGDQRDPLGVPAEKLLQGEDRCQLWEVRPPALLRRLLDDPPPARTPSGGPANAPLSLQGDDPRDAKLGGLAHNEVHGAPPWHHLSQGDGQRRRGRLGHLPQNAGPRPARGCRHQRGHDFPSCPLEDFDFIAWSKPKNLDHLPRLRRRELHPAVPDVFGKNEEPSMVDACVARGTPQLKTDNRSASGGTTGQFRQMAGCRLSV